MVTGSRRTKWNKRLSLLKDGARLLGRVSIFPNIWIVAPLLGPRSRDAGVPREKLIIIGNTEHISSVSLVARDLGVCGCAICWPIFVMHCGSFGLRRCSRRRRCLLWPWGLVE